MTDASKEDYIVTELGKDICWSFLSEEEALSFARHHFSYRGGAVGVRVCCGAAVIFELP